MSFVDDIYTLMTADTSLNGQVNGGIHYENLIDNWLADTDDTEWIVYEQRKSAQENCINSKNIYMTYRLTAVIIQRNTNTNVDTITNRLITYLNNYESGNIMDIAFISDQGGFNQQQNIYTNTLEFDCVYLET